jgi:predicted DNA-binding WGR domain protein
MRRFEFVQESSNKFWEVDARGAALHVAWGKIGTKGQSQTKDLASADAAQSELAKLVAKKLKEGYVEIAAREAAPATATASGDVERATGALLALLDARIDTSPERATDPGDALFAKIRKDKAMKAIFEPLRKDLSLQRPPAKATKPSEIDGVLRTIAELHARAIEADDLQSSELRALTSAELAALEEAAEAPLPPSLRAFLSTAGMLFPYDLASGDIEDDDDDDDDGDGDREEDKLPFASWLEADAVVKQTRELAALPAQHSIFPDDPLVVLSHDGAYHCCRLTDGAMVRVDDHDGELTELGLDFAAFLERYARGFARKAGLSG